ncbi:hypothetical protein [Poseidonibacter lekithochrous]|uniref:hypothetical protein n=1 Tax=Poseidonibacter lekithochrous TaxID=1904463 RepID=UPI000D3B3D9A|nr:hypothetical protein [Poseidonibacter lekithochrous]
MKQNFIRVVLSLLIVSAANAGNKFNDLTEAYLTEKASLDVRMTIAKDPETSLKVLKVLTQDSNSEVSKLAKEAIK